MSPTSLQWFIWIKQQWKGELSLSISFLGVGFLTQVLMFGLGQLGGVFLAADNSYVVLFALLILSIVDAVIFVWWGTGAWRSATKQRQKGGRRVWSEIAKASISVLFLIVILQYSLDIAPVISNLISDIEDDPQWGARGVRVVQVDKVEIYGKITRSVTEDFERVITSNPSISTVTFDSKGGRFPEALKIKTLIEAHHLDTLVVKECSSACTVAFLGGKQRQIARNARMGFHKASVGSRSDLANQEPLRDAMVVSKISKTFIDKVITTPPDSIWYPTLDELMNAGVITGELNHIQIKNK